MKKLSAESAVKSFFNTIENRGDSFPAIGVNSGTSCDGVDVALVEFGSQNSIGLKRSKTYKYSRKIRESLLSAGAPGFTDGEQWMKLDSQLGKLMGKYISNFILLSGKENYPPLFIATHGHTIRHLPHEKKDSLTLQIGDAHQIARLTGLPVISDFRKSDIAAGGQGAPLSPLLHQQLFRNRTRYRAIVNIGGIANITILPPSRSRFKPFAADCGPGNMAIDAVTKILFGKNYDKNGEIASGGNSHKGIINRVLRQKFFNMPPPKSTGREQFGNRFAESIIKSSKDMSAEDIVATISQITVRAIADFILLYAPKTEELFLCGGGAKNHYLVSGLAGELGGIKIDSTAKLGYDPDYLEAMLWAYLGYCFSDKIRVDSGRYTKAGKKYIPGSLCLP